MFIQPAVLVLIILVAGAGGATLTAIALWIWHIEERLNRLERSIREENKA